MDAAIDSVRSRMSEDCSSTPPLPLSPADVSPCPALARRAGGDDRGRAGARATAFSGSGGRAADLLASSSAMMRRMEARISSIDGS
jgi:hypothetical protein